MDLFYDYRTNLPLYPAIQAYFREHQPPMLIVWGKNDKIFPADGAYPYKRDLPQVEFHFIDTGHFALEDKADEMVPLIRDFLRPKGRAAMKRPSASSPYSSDVAFTPAVKAIQSRKGSRQGYASMEERGSWETRITPDLAEFIGRQAASSLERLTPTASPTSSIAADHPAFSGAGRQDAWLCRFRGQPSVHYARQSDRESESLHFSDRLWKSPADQDLGRGARCRG